MGSESPERERERERESQAIPPRRSLNMIRIWGTGYPYPPLDLPPGSIFRYEGGWDVWGPAWGDARLWTFAITEKEPAIVTGTDVRLAPWNSVLFWKQGGWQR